MKGTGACERTTTASMALAVGMPVLATVSEDDEVVRVVRECDCGAYVLPGDAETAADVLARWADNPKQAEELGSNARACFENNYRLSHAVEAYRNLFEDIIDGGTA